MGFQGVNSSTPLSSILAPGWLLDRPTEVRYRYGSACWSFRRAPGCRTAAELCDCPSAEAPTCPPAPAPPAATPAPGPGRGPHRRNTTKLLRKPDNVTAHSYCIETQNCLSALGLQRASQSRARMMRCLRVPRVSSLFGRRRPRNCWSQISETLVRCTPYILLFGCTLAYLCQ